MRFIQSLIICVYNHDLS